ITRVRPGPAFKHSSSGVVALRPRQVVTVFSDPGRPNEENGVELYTVDDTGDVIPRTDPRRIKTDDAADRAETENGPTDQSRKNFQKRRVQPDELTTDLFAGLVGIGVAGLLAGGIPGAGGASEAAAAAEAAAEAEEAAAAAEAVAEAEAAAAEA